MNSLRYRISNTLSIIVICFCIFFTIHSTLYRTYQNIIDISQNRGVSISNGILSGSLEVRQKTNYNDIFLINSEYFPFDIEGPVFSMLFDRPMFFSGEQFIYWFKANPDEIIIRKDIVEKIFHSNNNILIYTLLKENQIKYLVDRPNSRIGFSSLPTFLTIEYQNESIRILKIQ